MRRTRLGIVAVAALALLAGACGGGRAMEEGPGEVVAEDAIPVRVDNTSAFVMDVYLLPSTGITRLLGTVRAGAVETLPLDPDAVMTGTVQLVAVPLGGRGIARSGPLLLRDGSSVRFTIRPDLVSSVATVH